MKRVYIKDNEAFARVMEFSLRFTKLDRDARTYGQLIYSSFLNLSVAFGIERYSPLVAVQPEKVRQRVRDFIFYGATHVPGKEPLEVEKAVRSSAPLLFPQDYVFGADDVIFKVVAKPPAAPAAEPGGASPGQGPSRP
jgi:hypothetical protein